MLLQSVAFGEVEVVDIKDLDACILGNPYRTKDTGETVIRMCIDGKRHIIHNVSTTYGYEELAVEKVYQDQPYGKCTCSTYYTRTNTSHKVANKTKAAKKPRVVPNKEVGYSNVRGNKLIVLDKTKKNARK